MLLIIEGNEGTGKTTLINQLAEEIPFVTIKYPKEVKNTFQMLNNFTKDSILYVLDRSFISDIVYRRLDHKKGQMTLYQIGQLCGSPSGIKIIFCHHDKAFENAVKRGETNITVESVHKIITDGFFFAEEMLKNFTDIDIFDYNYEYQDVNDVIEFIRGRNQG
jgi:thymidylate kinase